MLFQMVLAMRKPALNPTEYRRMVIAKRDKENKKRILEFVKSHGQATTTQLKLLLRSDILEPLLSDLVKDGHLRRKRGFDSLGRVRYVYTIKEKVK